MRWSASRRSPSCGVADASAGNGPIRSLDLPRVLRVDIVVDEALELDGELVVRAAQRLHVLAVNVDGAVRRLAGARQADADIRRLRLAGAIHHAAHDGEGHRLDTVVAQFPLGHLVPDVPLDPLGELLEGAARGAAAPRTRGDARRKRAQAERL